MLLITAMATLAPGSQSVITSTESFNPSRTPASPSGTPNSPSGAPAGPSNTSTPISGSGGIYSSSLYVVLLVYMYPS